MNAIETSGLIKKYTNKNVVNGIDLRVPEGSIYGFIGKNGAGKSTTQKMICGLTPVTSGDIKLFGKSYKDSQIRSKVGMLIENAGVYPNLTAKENMRLYALAIGVVDIDKEIEKILNIVGLKDTGKKKVKQFSLGMKQRLGIAIALLGNPKLLILDEPTNGLDPQGIIEFRETIIKLNRELNMTILISSHILGELAKIATHYGVIRDGEMVAQMSAVEVDKTCRNYQFIRVDNAIEAKKLLLSKFNDLKCEEVNDNELHIFDFADTKSVNKLLSINGFEVEEIYMHKQDLEEYFMNLMGGVANA